MFAAEIAVGGKLLSQLFLSILLIDSAGDSRYWQIVVKNGITRKLDDDIVILRHFINM